MDHERFVEEARPTRGGKYIAYDVEVKYNGMEWQRIKTADAFYENGQPCGIPGNISLNPCNQEFRLFTWNQAVGLAHWVLADAETRVLARTKVRIVPHQVVYDMKVYVGLEPIEMDMMNSFFSSHKIPCDSKD